MNWKEYARQVRAERDDLRHTVRLQAEMLTDRREFVRDWELKPDGTYERRPPAQGSLL